MSIITPSDFKSTVNAGTDWISMRSAQSYPLADNTSDIAAVRQWLPPFLLLDIYLLLPSAANNNISSAIYISKIEDNGQSLRLAFAHDGIDFAQCAGISKTFTSAETIANRTYTITPIDISADALQRYPWMNKVTGTLCAGFTSKYQGGTYTFTGDAAKLNSMCVHFIAGDHLEAIVADGKYLTGQVQLIAQNGIICTVQENTIHLSLDKDYINTLIENKHPEINDYIKSINGQVPDENHNINIAGLDCVQVTPAGDHTLTISNPCAKPCCKTQSSLQNMQASIDLLQEEHKILRDYFVNMSTNINYMQSNLTSIASTR